MKHIKTLLISFYLLITQTVNCQNLKLKALLSIYNSNSLTYSFNSLQNISHFNGGFSSGINSSDSSIRGKMDGHDFQAWKQANKIAMSFFLDDNATFNDLKEDAGKLLYLQEIDSAISGGVKRTHFVFSNVHKMKRGNLELILSRCTNISSNKIYFQIDISDNR